MWFPSFFTRRSRLALLWIGMACLWLGGRTAHADDTLDKIRQRGTVVVGVMLSGPPFGSIDPVTHQHVGYNVQLAEGVARELGVKLQTVQLQTANRVAFLQQGKVDLLIANMQRTPEREEIMFYAPTPFEEVGGAAVAPKGSALKSWEDLRGKPVCVSQGSNYAKVLSARYNVEIRALRGVPESLLALRGGSCAAAVHVGPTLRYMVQNNPEWADYEIVLPTDLDPLPSVVWMRKGESDTRAAVERIVQGWHRTGWLIQVEKAHGMTPTPLLHRLHERFKNGS